MLTDLLNNCTRKRAYKHSVAKSFDRAALTYDDFANFQLDVLSKLTDISPTSSCSISLDLGCGTGNAADFLRQVSDTTIALDLSPLMLKKSATKYSESALVCADAEKLPFVAGTFDLVFSNLAIQWSKDLPKLSYEVNNVLASQGYFLGSSLCYGSMHEISECWLSIDGTTRTNQYLDYDNTLKKLASSGLSLQSSYIEPKTMWFDSPEDAIDSLKKVGASLLVDQKKQPVITPSLWRAFLEKYEGQRTEKGIPLTYQVIYFLFQKQ